MVRQQTYDHGTFPLVFAENKNYGFERNTLEVRREALGFCGAGLIIAATVLPAAASHHLHGSTTAMGIRCVAGLLDRLADKRARPRRWGSVRGPASRRRYHADDLDRTISVLGGERCGH
jgi:hypothetical protein